MVRTIHSPGEGHWGYITNLYPRPEEEVKTLPCKCPQARITPVVVMSVRYCYDNEEEEITDKLGSEPAIYLLETTTENSPMVNPELTTEQKRQLDELMDEFNDVFSDAPGTTTKAEHSIRTGDAQPVYHPPYRIRPAWQKQVREEVQSMLQAGIIEHQLVHGPPHWCL